jgi:hypothetical protein
MKSKKIILKMSKGDDQVGYLYLPKHPKEIIYGLVKKSVPIHELMADYKGIPLYFDFDQEGELIGIEIVG